MQSSNFIEAQNTEWKTVEPGITRQIMGYDDKILLAKVRFQSGVASGAHAHQAHSQSSYVESGVFEITIDGESRILRAGDGFFAPIGAMHGARCIEAGVLIDTFSPVRSDFF